MPYFLCECIRMDYHIWEHRRRDCNCHGSSAEPFLELKGLPCKSLAVEEMSQRNVTSSSRSTPVLPSIRKKQLTAGECFYCGNRGHFIDAWPVPPKKQSLSVTVGILVGKMNKTVNSQTHSLEALVDSDAKQTFIDQTLGNDSVIPLITLPKGLQISAINGTWLPQITRKTQPVSLSLCLAITQHWGTQHCPGSQTPLAQHT